MATDTQIRAIINRIAPYCQKYAEQYGYKVCSPAIAQALQESLGKYDGLSLLAYKYHNLHGLKCGSAWLKAGKPSVSLKTGEEYRPGVITQITDYFRVFPTEADGIKGYYDFLNTKRYANLKNCVTPEQYMTEIKRAGYCTSTTYVQNCLAKIDRYNLTQYDGMPVPDHNTQVDVTKFPLIKRGNNNDPNYVKVAQTILAKHGFYKGKIDGIYGLQSYNACVSFQAWANVLPKDGIIGVKTWSALFR